MSTPVAITAVGQISCVGVGMAALEAALRQGSSGLGPVNAIAAAKGAMGGEVPGLEGREGDEGDGPLPRALLLLDQAVHEALTALGPRDPEADAHTAVIVGTAQGALPQLPGTAAHHLAQRHGFGGPRRTIGMACVSSAVALVQGAEHIRRGWARRVVVAGFEALHNMVWRGFDAMGVMAEGPCRPFDARRRGLNLGEGAAALILEPVDVAIGRGATPLAIIRGGAIACDARHLAAPDPNGAALATTITQALGRSGLTPTDVNYINAHATATLRGDSAEIAALQRALGAAAETTPISSIKGITGHTLGAAGALEAVATTLALQKGFLPPTVGLQTPMEGLSWDFIPQAGRAAPQLRRALLTWSAFGGHVCALVLERPHPEAP